MTKRVELLAPAGSMECFYAAVKAGADAVYLAGEKFGARAYAENFTTEILCDAIQYAHLFGVKVYLTLNTLIKERELDQVCDYVRPFYEVGLDGVIIQDFGVVQLLGECFPGMELHASTQMTVTGANGARLLQENGICRVVPARELSLEELKEIKKQTGMELEIFVHGAMCYAYSGQCLMSSVLGGRSGNRGRCAGPCRLPYQIEHEGRILNTKGADYPLSCKDLCTISLLPQLIEAGMDSFKIEGRMKSAEYVAGVTAIYRKYIDQIYAYQREDGSFSKELFQHYQVKQSDLEQLRKLYVRTSLQDGYFHRHNGSELLTLEKPCYETGNEKQLQSIRENYLNDSQKLPIGIEATFAEGAISIIKLWVEGGERTEVVVTGEETASAMNRPMVEQDFAKQLKKTGNTPFTVEKLKINVTGNCFMPNKAVNELRRLALHTLKNKLLEGTFRKAEGQVQQSFQDTQKRLHIPDVSNRDQKKTVTNHTLTITVNTIEQTRLALQFARFSSIYLASDLFDGTFATKNESEIVILLNAFHKKGIKCYILLPRVIRKNAVKGLTALLTWGQKQPVDGVVTNSLEGLFLAKQYYTDVISDAGLYSFNSQAADWLWEQGIQRFTLPYELNIHEMKELLEERQYPFDLIVYGYIPLMESAGCVAKTFGKCQPTAKILAMQDRYRKKFWVQTHCNRCDNTIYNTVPMCLLKEWERIGSLSVGHRMDFTIETPQEMGEILNYYEQLQKKHTTAVFPLKDYTKGYLKRGVE